MTQLDLNTFFTIQHLYADYASAVDSGDWDLWPDFFTEDCVYKLQPRENYERGYPLCTLSLTSKGMLKDRVYGIKETLYHDPYYQRHVVGAPRVRSVVDGRIECEANYAVFRTKFDAAGFKVCAASMHFRQRNDSKLHHLPNLIYLI
jgi:salicylate 5-hydroxylase small subunit